MQAEPATFARNDGTAVAASRTRAWLYRVDESHRLCALQKCAILYLKTRAGEGGFLFPFHP